MTFLFFLIVITLLVLIAFILGALLVKFWYMTAEDRKMTKIERKLNKLLRAIIYEMYYPED